MSQLSHGGDIYSALEKRKSVLDFSANINPLGVPEGVKEALVRSLDQCANYPDPLCRKLKKALAKKLQVQEETLIFGNGAADLIFRLVLAEKPRRALVLAPTFSEYEKALQCVGCKIDHYALTRQDAFRLEESFLDTLNSKPDMLFLCNPNNPTGQLIDQKLLVQIAEQCQEQGTRLVLDECFLDFLETPEEHTLESYFEKLPFLFILRAFTKNYAIPGLRLGYGLCCDRNLLLRVSEQGQPWSVSLPAQEAGIQALKEDAYLQKARALVFRERAWLTEQLSALGYQVFPPEANYIFFRLGREAAARYTNCFQEDMEEEGILIRCCANYRGLEKGYFRITVRTHEENVQLVEALQRREEQWQKQL